MCGVFFILLLYLALFSLVACFRLDEIFAYWAPSSGEISNFLRVYMRCRLYCDERLWGGGFLADFVVIIAIHHTEMISFIKFFSCHSFFPAAAHAVEVLVFVAWFKLVLNSNVFDWSCVDLCWGVFFLGCRWIAYILVYSSFRCCVDYYLPGCSVLRAI